MGSELLFRMLKSDEELFVDDYNIDGLSLALGKKVTVVDNDGADFINRALGTT